MRFFSYLWIGEIFLDGKSNFTSAGVGELVDRSVTIGGDCW
jgi:hypothetical protein